MHAARQIIAACRKGRRLPAAALPHAPRQMRNPRLGAADGAGSRDQLATREGKLEQLPHAPHQIRRPRLRVAAGADAWNQLAARESNLAQHSEHWRLVRVLNRLQRPVAEGFGSSGGADEDAHAEMLTDAFQQL